MRGTLYSRLLYDNCRTTELTSKSRFRRVSTREITRDHEVTSASEERSTSFPSPPESGSLSRPVRDADRTRFVSHSLEATNGGSRGHEGTSVRARARARAERFLLVYSRLDNCPSIFLECEKNRWETARGKPHSLLFPRPRKRDAATSIDIGIAEGKTRRDRSKIADPEWQIRNE